MPLSHIIALSLAQAQAFIRLHREASLPAREDSDPAAALRSGGGRRQGRNAGLGRASDDDEDALGRHRAVREIGALGQIFGRCAHQDLSKARPGIMNSRSLG
jgi:hypothetical protein